MAQGRTILITGGAGFIGSHLVEELLRLGHRVTVVDDLSTGKGENLPPEARLVVRDIRDRKELDRTMSAAAPELVVHLAAQMNVRRSLLDPLRDADLNIRGSIDLFQASVLAGARRIVLASSGGAVYGDQPRYPCGENDLPHPTSPYGISKLAAEHYGRVLTRQAGREFVALRLANVYGPRQDPAGEAGVVALFLSELMSGRAPTILGDGTQTRDFVWVGDVVGAFVKALDGPEGVFNIGTGDETRIIDLQERLSQLAEVDRPPVRKAEIPGEVRRNALSIESARERLGWSPRTPLEQGLKATYDSMRGDPSIAASLGTFRSFGGRVGPHHP